MTLQPFGRHKCAAIALVLLVALPAVAQPTRSTAPQRPPNIILILADDLGWADLGCYGNKIHRTPNLDRLAAEGLRFTDAYAASSVCSPTRASIQSGKYPARLDLTLWLGGRSSAHAKLLDAPHARRLPLEEVTIAESLRTGGYVTGSIGRPEKGPEKVSDQKRAESREEVTNALVWFATHFIKRGMPETEVEKWLGPGVAGRSGNSRSKGYTFGYHCAESLDTHLGIYYAAVGDRWEVRSVYICHRVPKESHLFDENVSDVNAHFDLADVMDSAT